MSTAQLFFDIVGSAFALFGRDRPPVDVRMYVGPTGQVSFSGSGKIFSQIYNKILNGVAAGPATAYIQHGTPLPPIKGLDWSAVLPFLDEARTQLFFSGDNISFRDPAADIRGGSVEGGFQVSPPGEEFFMPGRNEIPPGGFAGLAQQTPAGQLQQYGKVRIAKPRRIGSMTVSARRGGPSYRRPLLVKPGRRGRKGYLIMTTGRAGARGKRKRTIIGGARRRRLRTSERARSPSSRAHLVKGSAAAKAWGRKMKALQKRRR